ncbi:MAG: PEGA domain-containing protein, partial [Bryobacteraceae bacterium]
GLTAVVVSSLANRSRVYTNLGTVMASVDGGPPVELKEDGIELEGSHRLTLGEGSDQLSILVEGSSFPTVTASVFSDRNVGSLLVSAGEDGYKVLLNGREVRRNIRDGVMRISNLPVQSYRLSVEKEGFQNPEEQQVQIKKGEETKVAFTLKPMPQVASLEISGAPAGTQIYVDDAILGTVSPAGRFSSTAIAPGDHNIELRNGTRYKPRALKRTFEAGETISLAGSDIALEKNASTVVIAAPAGSHVSYQCSDAEQTLSIASNQPVTVTCAEGPFTATASRPEHDDDTKSLELVGGERQVVNLAPQIRRTAARTKVTCGMTELRQARGWAASGNGSVQAKGTSPLPCSATPGTYEFTLSIPKGGFFPFGGKNRVKWEISHGARPALYQVDRKNFYAPDGTETNISAYQHDGLLAMRIEVSANRVVHSVKAPDGSWKIVKSTERSSGNLLEGNVAFTDDVSLSDFRFWER